MSVCLCESESESESTPGSITLLVKGAHQNNTQAHTYTSQTHAKSPPGVTDVIPPADTVVDQSGVEV